MSLPGGDPRSDDPQSSGMADVEWWPSILHVRIGRFSDGIKVEVAEAVTIQATTVSDNGSDGINLRKDSGVIAPISLISVIAEVNAESGLDIDADGRIKLSAITSENNGTPDVLP